jgi:hypothetical protein
MLWNIIKIDSQTWKWIHYNNTIKNIFLKFCVCKQTVVQIQILTQKSVQKVTPDKYLF